jgi:hypothetical protein
MPEEIEQVLLEDPVIVDAMALYLSVLDPIPTKVLNLNQGFKDPLGSFPTKVLNWLGLNTRS